MVHAFLLSWPSRPPSFAPAESTPYQLASLRSTAGMTAVQLSRTLHRDVRSLTGTVCLAISGVRFVFKPAAEKWRHRIKCRSGKGALLCLTVILILPTRTPCGRSVGLEISETRRYAWDSTFTLCECCSSSFVLRACLSPGPRTSSVNPSLSPKRSSPLLSLGAPRPLQLRRFTRCGRRPPHPAEARCYWRQSACSENSTHHTTHSSSNCWGSICGGRRLHQCVFFL